MSKQNNDSTIDKAGDHYSDLHELAEDLNRDTSGGSDSRDILKTMEITENKLAVLEAEIDNLSAR